MVSNKFILGTVQFGLDYGINNSKGKPSFKNVCEILDEAYLKGIRTLDTAEAYGNSQDIIGEYHKQSSNRFKIITKFSSQVKELPFNIIDRVNKDINTLQVDNLDCYMFHSFSDFDSYFDSFKNDLLYLKEEKKIKKIGVSVYTNQEFKKVLEHNEVDLVQLPFNLLDNLTIRGDIISIAKEKNIEIHTRSVFLQGLFFKNSKELHGNLKLLGSTLNKLHSICSEDYLMNDLALNYVYYQSKIDNVLIGVDNVDQLKSNIASIQKSISLEKIEKIEKIKIKETKLLNPSNWLL